MHLIDFYPSKGGFSPGEVITLLIELEAAAPQEIKYRMYIQHLAESTVVTEGVVQISAGQQVIPVQWAPPPNPAGYSARLEVFSANHSDLLCATTAFDVLSHWTDFPRYGFLTDFSASRADPDVILKKLARFHINGLQFYDWQYRHDQLLAPTEDYVDPLGREMSLTSVRKLVDEAHRHGMAAMPYLAVYAASADFWQAHPEWALYDEEQKPIPFGENFLGLMNPSASNAWSRHLLAECTRTLQAIPFDGLHIDQYGEPKQAWDAYSSPVNLPGAFVDFIQSASNRHPDKTILFNAVGNWPIEALVESAADFTYIEIWPPDVEYRQVAEMVLNAVRCSRGKAVVIAIYLPAGRPANNMLADAVILACGGTRIELGEEARLLSDPYFPKHEEISSGLESQLRRFYDFAVRNGEWLRPYTLSGSDKGPWAESTLNPGFVSGDESIWTVVRKHPESLVLPLVNLKGLDSHQRWDEEHPLPTPCQNIILRLETDKRPSQILWDAPENSAGPQPLSFEYNAGILTFQIPYIHLTGLVAIHE